MMLSRLMPNATPGSTSTPSSSGPRWRIDSHIWWTSANARSRPNGHRTADDSTNPAMPHINSGPQLDVFSRKQHVYVRLDVADFHDVDRRWTDDAQGDPAGRWVRQELDVHNRVRALQTEHADHPVRKRPAMRHPQRCRRPEVAVDRRVPAQAGGRVADKPLDMPARRNELTLGVVGGERHRCLPDGHAPAWIHVPVDGCGVSAITGDEIGD